MGSVENVQNRVKSRVKSVKARLKMTCKCLCCILENLLKAIKGINVSCDIPQPFKATCTIENPVEITGSITAGVTGSINCNLQQPIQVSGTINTISTDACAEAWTKILSQSSTFKQIVFKNDEQYGNVTDLTVDGSIVSFNSQNQKIQTTVCNIEFVLL